jgi:chaperone modulatory protein CbpM
MTMAHATFTLLDDANVCSFDELADVSGLTSDEVALLVDSGVLVPVDPVAAAMVFHLHYVVVANTARRLRDDFELEGHGLALALTLLRRVHEAEAELAAVRAQFARNLQLPPA